MKCLNCGIRFKPTRKDKVFCSDNCQQIHYRKYGTIRTPKKHYTLFKCPKCRQEKILSFDALRDKRWLKVKCSNCDYKVAH